MPDHDFDSLLERAVYTVLESMFFTTPLGPAGEEAGSAGVEASVRFRGPRSGALGVRISEAGARTLAAAFLGVEGETLSACQPGQVACELANMLCGWLLSNLEDELFVLGSPELISAGSRQIPGAFFSAQRSFAIENGILTVCLQSIVPA